MPARFARGVHAYALCDRCGQRYEYLALRVEWTGSFVCPDCFETKHPQLSPPKNIHDPQGLKNPRPDRVEPQTGGLNNSAFSADFVYPGGVNNFRPLAATNSSSSAGSSSSSGASSSG